MFATPRNADRNFNQLVVGIGHKIVPEAIESVRGDTFVVETDIDYPTESNLIGDGLRMVVTVAAKLAKEQGVGTGWRQFHGLVLKNIGVQGDRKSVARTCQEGLCGATETRLSENYWPKPSDG